MTNYNLTQTDLLDIYNCVTIVVANRERDNEISALFDDDFVDPIIDRLQVLKDKLERKLDELAG
jgi:hypothetical protein